MMMWWPVLSASGRCRGFRTRYQMAYLFVQSLLPAVIAAFITFSDTPVYDFYEQAPRVWGISAVEDQQIARGPDEDGGHPDPLDVHRRRVLQVVREGAGGGEGAGLE